MVNSMFSVMDNSRCMWTSMWTSVEVLHPPIYIQFWGAIDNSILSVDVWLGYIFIMVKSLLDNSIFSVKVWLGYNFYDGQIPIWHGQFHIQCWGMTWIHFYDGQIPIWSGQFHIKCWGVKWTIPYLVLRCDLDTFLLWSNAYLTWTIPYLVLRCDTDNSIFSFKVWHGQFHIQCWPTRWVVQWKSVSLGSGGS